MAGMASVLEGLVLGGCRTLQRDARRSPHIIRGCLGPIAQEKLLLSQKGPSPLPSAARGPSSLAHVHSRMSCPSLLLWCGSVLYDVVFRLRGHTVGEQGGLHGGGVVARPPFLPTGTQSCSEAPVKTLPGPPGSPLQSLGHLWGGSGRLSPEQQVHSAPLPALPSLLVCREGWEWC